VSRRLNQGATALMAAAIVAGPAAGGAAQAPGQPPAQPPAAAAPTADPAPPPENQGFAYRPEGRRDPFVSLLRRGSETTRDNTIRPAGLAGIAAAELTLRGVLQSRGGYVALVQGVDNKTYIVKPGEKLFDGVVRTITADAMVILQQVNDPLSLEKQREVRKVLRQTDEAK